MNSEPEIVELPDRPYAGIPASVTLATLDAVLPPLMPEVAGWLAARGTSPAGPPFWRYTMIDMYRLMEVQVGFPVAPGAVDAGDERVLTGVLPAGRYATLRHVGHPETVIDGHRALQDWAKALNLTWDVDGNNWGCRLEILLTDPASQPDMTKWETDISYRLAD